MTGETPTPDAAGGAQHQQAGPPVAILAQYIKDMSFEAPSAPGIFAQMQQEQPDISVGLDVNANRQQDGTFEVVLQANVSCKAGVATAFLMELTYGGLFRVNVPDEHLQAILLIECPRLLFPFVRAIIADSTRDGGFPPLMLAPVDFVAMFQNKMQEMAAAQAQAQGAAPSPEGHA
ncbi:MAG: protein-export chaperone SecB [Rhodobacterales bacterium]|nr:protein-export chaperone SecB [Rhodobacterales bacterium]